MQQGWVSCPGSQVNLWGGHHHHHHLTPETWDSVLKISTFPCVLKTSKLSVRKIRIWLCAVSLNYLNHFLPGKTHGHGAAKSSYGDHIFKSVVWVAPTTLPFTSLLLIAGRGHHLPWAEGGGSCFTSRPNLQVHYVGANQLLSSGRLKLLLCGLALMLSYSKVLYFSHPKRWMLLSATQKHRIHGALEGLESQNWKGGKYKCWQILSMGPHSEILALNY